MTIEDLAVVIKHSLDKTDERVETLATTMKEGFENIERRFEGINERFEGVDERFDNIDRRFDGVDRRFDGIDRRLDDMNHRVAANGDHLIRIENRLDAEFASIRSRFERLEARV